MLFDVPLLYKVLPFHLMPSNIHIMVSAVNMSGYSHSGVYSSSNVSVSQAF